MKQGFLLLSPCKIALPEASFLFREIMVTMGYITLITFVAKYVVSMLSASPRVVMYFHAPFDFVL